MINRKYIYLLGLVSAISISIFLLFSFYYDGIGFPLDDSWIHQTYARNIANGEGWSFVAGEASAGLTAPLWGLILSLGHWLGLGPYLFTFFIGWIILWGLSVLGSYGLRILLPEKEKWAIAFGILIATEWHLVWAAVSGMETLLYALIVIAVVVLLLDNKTHNKNAKQLYFIGVLVGVSVWVRPEGLTLMGPIILLIFITEKSLQSKLKKTLWSIFGFGTLFIPYLYFNKFLAGEWWPNTFYAKQAEYAILKESPLLSRIIEQFGLPMVGVGILLLPGFIHILIIAIRKKQWTILATTTWMAGHLIIYAIKLPVIYQHGRYAIPAMPVYFLVAFSGVVMLLNTLTEKMLDRVIFISWRILIPIICLIFLFSGANAYRQDVKFINSQMVDVAKWISVNIPQEKLIAAHDIGAIGYFSNREIVDLAGLISPEAIPFIRDQIGLENLLNSRKVGFLVTFPDWYPTLILGKKIIYQAGTGSDNKVGGENMTIYCWDCP